MLIWWSRLPVLVQAVVLGLVVNGLGTLPWAVLYATNQRLWPAVPWSVPAIAVYLWVYWQYVGGRWWPRSTSEGRSRALRARPLPSRVWAWSLVVGALGWLTIVACRVWFDTFVGVPYERLPSAPYLTMAAYIGAASAVAGVAEEAGFRGYMQGPLERRYGPLRAVLVVGTLFWLAHLSHFGGHGWLFIGFGWYYLAAAGLFGWLACRTDSIRPGVVLHLGANLLGFALMAWWTSPSGPAAQGPAPRGPVLWIAGTLALAFASAATVAHRRLGPASRGGGPAATSEG